MVPLEGASYIFTIFCHSVDPLRSPWKGQVKFFTISCHSVDPLWSPWKGDAKPVIKDFNLVMQALRFVVISLFER